jgi:hypothetical protein
MWVTGKEAEGPSTTLRCVENKVATPTQHSSAPCQSESGTVAFGGVCEGLAVVERTSNHGAGIE